MYFFSLRENIGPYQRGQANSAKFYSPNSTFCNYLAQNIPFLWIGEILRRLRSCSELPVLPGNGKGRSSKISEVSAAWAFYLTVHLVSCISPERENARIGRGIDPENTKNHPLDKKSRLFSLKRYWNITNCWLGSVLLFDLSFY